ncbi:uncharacterized protein LOC143632065 [Bidens hawaiensis]|uniref:uncharacterized protein LOC143632065 n=1 Tax=Bidens hawaiensis TaxID=980011 RepID=UPI00404B5C30
MAIFGGVGDGSDSGSEVYVGVWWRYCSNYYNESSDPPEHCDWCKAEDVKSSKHVGSSKKPAGVSAQSEYSGEKIKLQNREEGSEKRRSPTGAPSPRNSTRRYKLLKDVMC